MRMLVLMLLIFEKVKLIFGHPVVYVSMELITVFKEVKTTHFWILR